MDFCKFLKIIIFIQMGKIQCQQTHTVNTKQGEISKKKKSGRPINCDIENLFINIIRDTKLQAINAQVQLQLEIAFFTNDQAKKSRNRSQSSVSDKWIKINQFLGLSSDQKTKIHQFYDECQQKWTFKQIQQESDLQGLFFDDQSDMAFVLHNFIKKRKQTLSKDERSLIQNQKRENKCNELKAEELFYLCLLSLNSRQNLRDVVLDFLLKNQNLIVNIIWASMEKAKVKYDQKINRSKQGLKQFAEHLSSQIHTVKQSEIILQESICDQSQLSRLPLSHKKIKKSSRKKTRQNGDDSDDSCEGMTQKQRQEKLILCFVNYISWSYLYVYGEEDQSQEDIKKEENNIQVETNKSQ